MMISFEQHWMIKQRGGRKELGRSTEEEEGSLREEQGWKSNEGGGGGRTEEPCHHFGS